MWYLCLQALRRDDSLDRISRLDCNNPDRTLASCDPSLPPPPEAAGWRRSLEDARVDEAAYAKALAAALKTLVCLGGGDAIDTLRGLVLSTPEESFLPDAGFAAAGPEAPALVDFIMSKDCPVSASLTEADKARLLRIKQAASKKPGG